MQAPAAAMTAQPSHAVIGAPSYASQALGSTDTMAPGHVTHLVEKYERHANIKDRQVKQEAVRRQRMVEPAFHPGSMRRAPQDFAPFQVSVLVACSYTKMPVTEGLVLALLSLPCYVAGFISV